MLDLPTDFTSSDSLRVFRCNQFKDGYIAQVMNTKYPKVPFVKNGIESFELSWRKGGFTSREDDMFSSELFYNDSLYMAFIGKSRENQVAYEKFKHDERIDIIYSTNVEEKEFEIHVQSDNQMNRKIYIRKSIENDKPKVILVVEENKQELYRQELEKSQVDEYLQALVYKALNIISEVHTGIQTLNKTIFDMVFSYYGIAQEFMNIVSNSTESNEVIDGLFAKYFNSPEFKKTKETWIETMHRVASRLTPSVKIKFIEEHDAEIKAKMQRIIKEETLSEYETDKEREDYDPEEENMILGVAHMEHIGKMIEDDFKEDGEKKTQSTSSGKVLTKTINMEKRLRHMREMIRKDFEEE